MQHSKIDVQSKSIRSYVPYCYKEYDFINNEEIPILFLAVQKQNSKIEKLFLSYENIDVNSKYIVTTYSKDEKKILQLN